MARPRRYEDDRVDTKVRLRLDHHRRLDALVSADPSVSRNRIIEEALDLYFARPRPRPRLTVTPAPDQDLTARPPGKKPPRVGLRVMNVAQDMADQAPPGPNLVQKVGKTRVRPRKNI